MHYTELVKHIEEVPHGSICLTAKSVLSKQFVTDMKWCTVQHAKDVRETILKDQQL